MSKNVVCTKPNTVDLCMSFFLIGVVLMSL